MIREIPYTFDGFATAPQKKSVTIFTSLTETIDAIATAIFVAVKRFCIGFVAGCFVGSFIVATLELDQGIRLDNKTALRLAAIAGVASGVLSIIFERH